MTGKVLSAARRDSYVLSQDGRFMFQQHCHEMNAATTFLTNERHHHAGLPHLHCLV
jgi:hypothetical protein